MYRYKVPVSIKDVAALAGVSVATVSNVLNQPEIVAESTRNRVNAAIAELGFVRNESARQLRAGRSRMLGLVVLDVSNPFFTDVARGVEDEASTAGLAVILCNSDDQEGKESRYLDLLEEHRVQGVLITPVAGPPSGAGSRLAQLQERGTPVVLVDSRSPRGGQCSVAVDDVLGGDLAMTHLLASGHERVAYLAGPPTIRQVADRHEGALRALTHAGRPAGELLVIQAEGLNAAAGKQAAADIAARPAAERPTGVFCANDLIALGVLQELTREGIRVPEDIAIVGYDDIEFAAGAAVPLTSVRQPRLRLGRTAARLLLDEVAAATGTLDGRHEHRQVIFQPELVVRQSAPAAATGTRSERPLPGLGKGIAGPQEEFAEAVRPAARHPGETGARHRDVPVGGVRGGISGAAAGRASGGGRFLTDLRERDTSLVGPAGGPPGKLRDLVAGVAAGLARQRDGLGAHCFLQPREGCGVRHHQLLVRARDRVRRANFLAFLLALPPGLRSRPAMASSSSAPTVCAAQARLAPIPPVAPRLAQPTT
jgi:LacI family transcriptional regulator